MLAEIQIKNFVLIEDLQMAFAPGLNVITGETGAGKSIIIDALGLIMGERVRHDYLRDTSRKAILDAVFDLDRDNRARGFLEENGYIEADVNTIVISRELDPQGKNLVRINGRVAPLNLLKKVAPYLIDIHVQYDNLNLLKPESFLSFVDGFASEMAGDLAWLAALFADLKESRKKLQTLSGAEANQKERMEFLHYQLQEIEGSQLQAGEEEELLKTRERIQNLQQLMQGCDLLQQLLYHAPEGNNSAYELLYQGAAVSKDFRHEEMFQNITGQLEEMCYSIEEISIAISNLVQELDFEPGKLEEIENRLYTIRQLQKKYGDTVADILIFGEKVQEEIQALKNSEIIMDDIVAQIRVLEAQYDELAASVREQRKQAASFLQEQVHAELMALNMPHVEFKIDFREKEGDALGTDEVEFMFSPNPGEPMRPLARIASGGEISRFVLALKKALARVYAVPTLIFDEIDIGVGGTALKAMAGKLLELGSSHQVLLVTHAPQIASRAGVHYLIEKNILPDHSTIVAVKKLEPAERVQEVARMLGGENFSSITLQHAEEMMRL